MTIYDDTISRLKQELGDDLLILAHHYQTDDVLQHAHVTGDSLELARKIPGSSATHIVFCGVSFMAETAAMLAGEGQHSYIPDKTAGCIMSAMAPADLVETVLTRLGSTGRRIVPLTYVNSSAAVKAVVGRAGGSVCTSANASTMLRWAMDQGDAVLFLPDKNLALNTADALDLGAGDRHILDIRHRGEAMDREAADSAKLLIWPGCCAIHNNRFKAEHIRKVRRESPGCTVAVHPECRPEVVQMADAAGSTSFLIKYAADAPAGSTVYIGTEINLVQRLTNRHKDEKSVLPLAVSDCLNMAKITTANLAATLQTIADGGPEAAGPVVVDAAVAAPAREAVQRMLDICAKR